MAKVESPYCPECDEAFDYPEPPPLDRRDFIRIVGGTAAAISLASVGNSGAEEAVKPQGKTRPAEELIRELHASLDDSQKKQVVLDYNLGAGKAKGSRPLRLGMYNSPIATPTSPKGLRIDEVYNKSQQELIERIVKSMCRDDAGYNRISRNGKWDSTGALTRCGALIFGDPTPGQKFAFVLAGHHLTLRCDGDTEEGPAFGGPIYYGHSAPGYSPKNVFNYQTQSVLEVYDALSAKQREQAVIKKGTPGEQYPSVVFKARPEDRPGIRAEDLTRDQRALVEKVMRDILLPYRQEDVDEVMTIIKKNGGMDKIQLAFYPDKAMEDDKPWHFWRLEGPGFVWNYRVLDHVHTFVNISSKLNGV